MAELYANNFETIVLTDVPLEAGPTDIELDITVADFQTLFPTLIITQNGDIWRARMGNELVSITNVNLDGTNVVVTTERGQETSTITAHGIGTHFVHIVTAESLYQIITQTLDLADIEHIDDTTDAHDASAISVMPAGNITSVDVQGALEELDTADTTHLNDATDVHDASAISVVPVGNIAATDVQAAIQELDTEKSGTAHSHALLHNRVHDGSDHSDGNGIAAKANWTIITSGGSYSWNGNIGHEALIFIGNDSDLTIYGFYSATLFQTKRTEIVVNKSPSKNIILFAPGNSNFALDGVSPIPTITVLPGETIFMVYTDFNIITNTYNWWIYNRVTV